VEDNTELLTLTADIAAAYVSNNTIQASDVPAVIQTIYRALASVGSTAAAPAPEPQKPAIPIKKSITPDFLICLEDGRKFKSLKRHLRTKYDMTPEQYRAKWSLPKDYPMVAPNYAAARSNLAKQSGLGQGGRKPAAATAAKAPRGRPPKQPA
jgi:predicted transcriptional regulator